MPTLPEAAEQNYRQQQQLAALTTLTARRLWSTMNPADLDATWTRIGRLLLTLLTAAQRQAAVAAVDYTAAALAQQNIDVAPVATVAPAALAGVSSSGAPLGYVIEGVVVGVKQDVGAGRAVADAMSAAQSRLDGIVLTQIADAHRIAAGLGVTVRPGVGYVRQVVPPACTRCLILAARTYRWSDGFARHPRCDCKNVPTIAARAHEAVFDPRDYIDGLSPQGQDALLGPANAQAFRDGADLSQLVNASTRQGAVQVASVGRHLVKVTTEGTTKRGIAGKRLGGRLRVMPEEIYQAASSRDEALRLLERAGFIV